MASRPDWPPTMIDKLIPDQGIYTPEVAQPKPHKLRREREKQNPEEYHHLMSRNYVGK